MPDKLWIGTNGDLSLTTNYSPTGLPGAGDKLYFRSPAFGGSIVPPTTNMNALSAVQLAYVHVDKEWWDGATPVDLGTSGTPIQLSADLMIYEGRGTLYLSEAGGTFSDLEIRSVNKTLAAQISAGTVARVTVSQGHCKLTAGTITHAKCTYVNSPADDAKLTVNVGAGAMTELIMEGGYADISVAITALIQGGGLVDAKAAVSDYFGLGGVTNYLVSNTMARAFAGGVSTLDCNRNNVPKTITYSQVSGGGRILYTSGRDTISPKMFGKAGK